LLLLLLSVVALVAGPILYYQLRRGDLIARAVDHTLALVLAVLVLVVLMPETFTQTGWIALPMMLFGYLAPILVEKGIHNAARFAHVATLAVAAVGLGLHSILDGAGLAGAEFQVNTLLPVAIIMHRLTVGMVLWFILEPAFGKRITFGVLGFVALGTVIGYQLVSQSGQFAASVTTYYIQAVILGTVIHGLIHRNHLAGHAHKH
jgi:hypothetical protein